MDFFAECEAAKEKRFSAIGALAFKRQQLSVDVERAQVTMKELDAEIAGHQTAVEELERVQRNFNSWLAVKEGALTTDQVAAAIQAEPSEHPLDAEVGGGTQPAQASVNGAKTPEDAERPFRAHVCAETAKEHVDA